MKFDLLIIDDDELFLFLGKHEVTKSNFHQQPLLFNSATAALEWLLEPQHITRNLLLFLDINMPVLNAWGFLDQLKTITFPYQIHVVIVSSSTDPQDFKKAETYPMVIKFFEKPLTKNLLQSLKTEKILSDYFTKN
jgi:CheY-like chemotaxis protein